MRLRKQSKRDPVILLASVHHSNQLVSQILPYDMPAELVGVRDQAMTVTADCTRPLQDHVCAESSEHFMQVPGGFEARLQCIGRRITAEGAREMKSLSEDINVSSLCVLIHTSLVLRY